MRFRINIISKPLHDALRAVTRWYWRRRARTMKRLLLRYDAVMRRAQFSRAERRRFWREFVKREDVRRHMLDMEE